MVGQRDFSGQHILEIRRITKTTGTATLAIETQLTIQRAVTVRKAVVGKAVRVSFHIESGFGFRGPGRQYFVAALRRTLIRPLLTSLACELSGVEQRVFFNLVGNEGFKLEIGQCQQLDRLLQLRRHHQ